MTIHDLQRRLRQAKLDGWLFYDFRRSNPIAYRTLGLPEHLIATRRWYYFVPREGAPVGLVSALEPSNLDQLPGKKIVYRTWGERETALASVLPRGGRVAMEYSPQGAIPTVSRVDAGTVEHVRSLGVDVVSSADLVQETVSLWSEEQWQGHLRASETLMQIKTAAFAEAARCLNAGQALTDYDLQQFMAGRYAGAGLVSDGPPIVATNEHCSNPHYLPSKERQTPIRAGDVLMLDFWAKLDQQHAVYADHTWMAYAGESVPAEVAQIFAIVAEARDRAIAYVRDAFAHGEAIQGWQVDDVARGTIAGRGYGEYFVHRTGHSIDVDVHGDGVNMDNYETHDARTLLPGSGFSIEPGIYLPQYGIRSEVNVAIRGSEVIVTGTPIQTEVVPLLGG